MNTQHCYITNTCTTVLAEWRARGERQHLHRGSATLSGSVPHSVIKRAAWGHISATKLINYLDIVCTLHHSQGYFFWPEQIKERSHRHSTCRPVQVNDSCHLSSMHGQNLTCIRQNKSSNFSYLGALDLKKHPKTKKTPHHHHQFSPCLFK